MRRAITLIGSLLFLTVLAISEPGGEIRGQLAITRVLTKKRVQLPDYQVRGATAKPTAAESTPVNEWDRVVVYLEGPDAPKAVPVKATIDQKGQRFEPDTVVVPVGSTVTFPNSDPIFHNVFSLSKAKSFDLGFYKAGDSRNVKLDQAGAVQVYCHLHSDMSAAILVAPNGWYLRPTDKGAFSFSNLPPARYKLVVWHKSAGFFYRQLNVTSGGLTRVSVEIPLEAEGS